MITKKKFCQYINYIRLRLVLVDDDRYHKEIRAILNKIRESFPRDEDSFCELEHYIIFTNFATLEKDENYGESEGELYDKLTNKHTNRNNLPKG